MTSRGPRTLCYGPETTIQCRSKPTNQITGVGAGDAYASKNIGGFVGVKFPGEFRFVITCLVGLS